MFRPPVMKHLALKNPLTGNLGIILSLSSEQIFMYEVRKSTLVGWGGVG